MRAGIGQDTRIAALTTPLPGKDVLGLARFEGGEGLSELFEFRIEAVSKEKNLDFTPGIGKNCHVEFRAPDGVKRYFNGVLVEAQWIGMKNREDYAYRLVLRPWLWLLSHSANCRIFRDMSADAIIKDVFEKAGFRDFDDQPLSEKPYPQIEYCVQYRETDLAFVSRLMEQYGIYYYFEHSAEKHIMVLADSSSSHTKEVPGGSLPYIPNRGYTPWTKQHIDHWMPERRFRTGKVELIDYDYLQSDAAELLAQKQGSEGYNKSDLTIYDFPGKYPRETRDTKKKTDPDGNRLAKVRLEAEQALDHRRHAAGNAVSLYPGVLFKLDDNPEGKGEKYLVVRATHSFSDQHYSSISSAGAEEGYFGHYEVLPSERQYRAPLLTPKPLIHGAQTAKVVDQDGQEGTKEIDVDGHGRIYLRFHWDRDDRKRVSRPVRVAQVWSGTQWGGQFIPRIGMEVVVTFLEGDPDRPLVVGAVYNDKHEYPYKSGKDKLIDTRSGIKSDTSRRNGGYNELYFEDEQGNELVYMQAEKDHELLIKNDETRTIKHDLSTTIENKETRVIQSNQTITCHTKISIEAYQEILLTVGPSTIKMTPAGITIDSPKTDVLASGMLTINGKIVFIN